ncbi:serologically defined colon cancer antigen 8 homolog isoform X6 [Vanessa tameamea]|uniref:Serologically defined colon cancer antigen 8 homolog isoform X6 n=1 Tax=Vanessa tameamea TaxID=334116 RepID=A0ABM4AVT1_VANTA
MFNPYYSCRRPVKMNEYGMKRIPDYTELAYKEAVSKLKYFLSGNNAPSVRSYGGSASIKNLDESDGELDKKYSSSFNTLSEYKPRPRLTAKYATLYADSLNNYIPPQPTVTNIAPPASADLSGGTNPDVVNFIQKQEEYIEQLERESQYCRDELNNLLGKVKEVISENEHLHEAQKNKLISRMFHTYNAGSETDDLDDVGDSTGLDSDNKISPSKTRRPKSRSVKLEGPNIVFESRIAELEAQLTQAKIDLKKVQDENNENKRKLANGLVDSTCLDGFKRQIDNLQRDKSTLESQISKLKLNLEQKEGDLDTRYKRGSDAVEQQLREERNNLEMEISRLKAELAAERGRARSASGEGARRAQRERSAAEQRYLAHCDELQHDLAAQFDNVAKLQLDLERQRREENDLKRELSMKNAAIEELKMELKNKSASLQADLAQAHAEKASLEEELASARLAIERHQRQSKHEVNRLNSEIQSLRQRLDRADADLVHSRRENLRLSEQISNLEKELNLKNLTPISPEKNRKEKELSTMLESMENKHGRAQSRSRADEPIRTQRDRSRSRDSPIASHRTRHRVKESDSSNNYPISVGPLTTNQDLTNARGEKIYNLPLMIQQPFLREKKEPIKVDISVKLIPKSRKKDRKRREAHVEELVSTDRNKGVKNIISMEVTDNNINVLSESSEVVDDNTNEAKLEEKEKEINAEKINKIEKDGDDVEPLELDAIVLQDEENAELDEEVKNESIPLEDDNSQEQTGDSEAVNLTKEAEENNTHPINDEPE